MVRIDDVIDTFLRRRPGADFSAIQRAYVFSAKQHEGQLRKSGEPYMVHPLEVARIIAEMGLDEASICGALLHDTIEDTATSKDEVTAMFGQEVAALVDGVTKLSGVNFTHKEQRQAESFRKLVVAMSEDIRVLLIKLGDRLHNMRTLEHMKPEARERIAQETREIYAPLADRLGIAWLKADLDDLAFMYLEPEAFEELQRSVDKTTKERKAYIQRTIDELQRFLKENGLDVKVTGRLKNFYSIHKKMRTKNIAYEDVHDAIAFRVVCDSLRDCYATLGFVHSRWVPVPGRFKDYVAMPKPNRYQSVHTTVVGKDGERIEIQIRTQEMHDVAEAGIAAHWGYKEGGGGNKNAADGFAWLRDLVEAQSESTDSQDFLESVKVDLFRDEVFVFTPEGEVKALRRGSSPLDFAFAVHTQVGSHCVGARVNGVQVPLRTELRNGDQIEIMTSKTQRPSPDWLEIAVTSRARNKIRAYLRQEQRKQARQAGGDLLEKALRKFGCSFPKMLKRGELEKLAGEMRFSNADDLIVAVGYGKVDLTDLINQLLPEDKRARPPAELKETPIERVMRKVKGSDDGIVLDGLDNLLVRFARCCNPLPGEDVVGFVSRGRGVVIHRRSCARAEALDPERRTKVQWSRQAVSQRPVKLRVTTGDRVGMLAAITNVFIKHDISIDSAHCQAEGHQRGVNVFTFMVRDLTQLNELVRGLKNTKDVVDVERVHY
ncbi:MAG: bifunctional (p)ppGpp synthetase/guanosine-3',5'-bis(diphosphate) 3'-pyrophosphohydrolase [Myxococcota bacterium]|jgi:GTP pyrophosphokinase|nr:bifunctional (p)ppGpp synthetase/guanosine-3',5'-bis(diphosphate) 3'-pyrophosphohydrolase [Myxococcota bacterium]